MSDEEKKDTKMQGNPKNVRKILDYILDVIKELREQNPKVVASVRSAICDIENWVNYAISANQDTGNAAAMHEALEEISSVSLGNLKEPIDGDSSNLYQDARYEGDTFVGVALPAWVAVDWYRKLKVVKEKAEAALSAPQHKGTWKNGTMYECEYAYCSECGRMQWAGWDSHKQAEENIKSFSTDYKFCPGCGAKMDGGVYVQ